MLTPLLEDERQELRNSLNLAPIDVLETHLRVAISLGTLPDDLTSVIHSNEDEHVQEYVIQTLFAFLKQEMMRASYAVQRIPSRLITALLLDANFNVFDDTAKLLSDAFTHEQIVLTLRRALAAKDEKEATSRWVRSWIRTGLGIDSYSNFTHLLIARNEDSLLAEILTWKWCDTRVISSQAYDWIRHAGLQAIRNCPKTIRTIYDAGTIQHQTLVTKGIIAIHPDIAIREQALDQLLALSSKKFIEDSIYAPFTSKPWRIKDANKQELAREVTKENILKLFATDPADKIRMKLANSTTHRSTLEILSADKNTLIAAMSTAKLAKITAQAARQHDYHRRKKGEPIPTV